MISNVAPMLLRDYDLPADRIRLHLQASDRVPILVEGPHDQLVLEPHLEDVTFFILSGRNNVLDALTQLCAAGIESVLGIVDRDFDPPASFGPLEDRLYVYGGIDLEGMLVELGVLADLLMHVGSAEKIRQLGGSTVLVEMLKSSVSPVSSLRLHNIRDALGVPFSEVDLQDKIDRSDLGLNLSKYCHALTLKAKSSLNVQDLIRRASSEEVSMHSGKDVAAAAGISLRRKAGSLPSAASTTTIISAQLRATSAHRLSTSEWMSGLASRLEEVAKTLPVRLVNKWS